MGKITFLPAGKSIKVRPGQSIISAARSARIVIPQRCGGHASCLMCRVVVESGEISQPSSLEKRKMPEADLKGGVRLACQAEATGKDCTIRIPESKWKSVVQAALERERIQNEEEW
ncbi:2Fe-2S iron-sulfur cluster-binding protein [Brevibacillus ruminantium]|uniref:2Fe-2S iron-sulfur cluster-binding protein n=1 Tax=Brevibacillus ruminantium TaxID=2950604 RepID=A0ABY4W9S9_9BACL|nr:2Fe-2S iron-sulfur cluster-binding protein [Brevibacillus ruminantium]USG63524.1 2Fe-2S iron-sulfur cluster-binding protein [Brevibacillus ruminantium]